MRFVRDPGLKKGVSILDGRYRLNQAKRAGGMASVYESRDLETDELVAMALIKRPATHMGWIPA